MRESGQLETPFSLEGRRIWVAGHGGMVGSALLRRLRSEACELLTCGRREVDLRRQRETEEWMAANRPDVVIIAAATVGGILANSSRPAEFLYDNLLVQVNVIEGARRIGVQKLLALGSSCIYPRLAEQPMPEEALLTGPLEETNQWYAIAKIAGLKLCEAYRRQYGVDFIAAMPCNLYGPGDNFDIESGHVIPGLLRKFHEAAESGAGRVTLWGTGRPRREFMYVDDCADALVHLLQYYSGEEHVNVGTGADLTIAELAELIAEVTGFQGELVYDRSKPDGTPQKLLECHRLRALGWEARTGLREGLERTYAWLLQQQRLAD